MTSLLVRGRTLSFVDRPAESDCDSCYRYEEDGALLVIDRKIVACGSYPDVLAVSGSQVPIADHRPYLILPGLIDAHAHFPQMQVIASYGAELMDWLNRYTFPEELKFADPMHASRVAALYLDELVRHGTTSAATYCSVHPASVDALFSAAERRDMLMIAGKVMMDRNAPEGLTDTAQSSYDDSKALIAKWHRKGRQYYAITPRFAITSTPLQLELAGTLLREHPDCHMQTHLSENQAEIALTLELYPQCRDYTDVYARLGLLGRQCLFGHCIHLDDREADALSESGSVAVFCPTSNLFLGSGLFDYQNLTNRQRPVRTALATDVGGGTNYSMLRTADEGYKIISLQGRKITPLQSFHDMTLGNARALNLQDRIGTLEAGSDADLVILDARATPAMALRMETATTLEEELFVLQVMGDDRAVVETYLAGTAAKGDLR